MQLFSIRLQELRKEAGLSQRQVAEKLNMRQQSYAQYESNKSEPNLETLAKIAEIFQVSADYLIGLKEFE